MAPMAMAAARPSARPSERAAAAVALLAGLALAALAAPRLAAAVVDLPARPVIAALRAGVPLDTAETALAAESRAAALALVDDGPARAELALLAARLGDDTREALRRALALSPAQGYAWARLARAAALSGAPRAAAALALAIRTAPHDPRLRPLRISLGLVLWPRLVPSVRALVAADIAGLAAADAAALVAVARRRHASALVRAALASRPGLAAAFDRALLRSLAG